MTVYWLGPLVITHQSQMCEMLFVIYISPLSLLTNITSLTALLPCDNPLIHCMPCSSIFDPTKESFEIQLKLLCRQVNQPTSYRLRLSFGREGVCCPRPGDGKARSRCWRWWRRRKQAQEGFIGSIPYVFNPFRGQGDGARTARDAILAREHEGGWA